MTKQITIKLNHDLFRPVLDKLTKFAGEGVTASDSDLVAKCIFFCDYIIFDKLKSGKTRLDLITESRDIELSEGILNFLGEYQKFKKQGLKKK